METSLGCIGCGNMGAAILRGLSSLEGVSLHGVDMDAHRLKIVCEECNAQPSESAREMVRNVDYILLAIKPHQVQTLLKDLAPRLRPGQTLISIAAGLTLRQLKEYSSGSCPVVRIMPNTPAMVQAGMFAICLDDPDLVESQKQTVLEMFSTLGKTFVLEEAYFDAFTAVAGSGPAYVFYIMDAMVEAGVTLGIPRPMALDMVRGLFTGSSKLAEQTGRHLCELREMVTSPAGTTVEATNVLDKYAVRAAFVDAIDAACRRSKELGE